MPINDFVTLASTKTLIIQNTKVETSNLPLSIGQNLWSICASKFLGYKKVVDRTIPYNNKIESANLPYSEILKRIDDINTQIFEGFKLILLIDSDLIDDNWDFKSLDYH